MKTITGKYVRACLILMIAPVICANAGLQEHTWGKTELFPPWAYDAGPDIATEMGKELVNLNSEIPCAPCMSEALLGEQKFRPAFGPIPWRMLQKPNSVKILFIGQDGTHIAEAAGRPATAGFGGRAQDLAKYFGVGPGAAFINAYAFTIRGQDGSTAVPVYSVIDGKPSLQPERVIGNGLWLLSRDLNSPMVQWRNSLIEWIIRNNRDSLKLIVTFGKPAQDAAAAFVLSRAAKFPQENKNTTVGTKYTAEQIKQNHVQVPEFQVVSLGSNFEGPGPLGGRGQDLYKEVAGLKTEEFTYDPETHSTASAAFIARFNADNGGIKEKMVFSDKGLHGSGIIEPAQLGGYDIEKMIIAPEFTDNRGYTLNLKGLKISEDMGRLEHDLLVVDLPHPTYLSRTQQDYLAAIAQNPALAGSQDPERIKSASEEVAEKVKVLRPYAAKGWHINPDYALDQDTGKPMVNSFAEGALYQYGRADMGPEFYDFGAPASRMVNVSSATRLDKSVIIFGGRDETAFTGDEAKISSDPGYVCEICSLIDKLKQARPEKLPSDKELWTTRPRTPEASFVFDPGPPPEYARLMKENLPEKTIESHPINKDYGHYRGTFNKPLVLILADQDGWDDLITSRALTGARGQYLHGLMKELGVGDRYLVIKTAPFSTEEKDWGDIFSATMEYRLKLFTAIMGKNRPRLIVTDGAWAAKEIDRLIAGTANPPPVVRINKAGPGDGSGIADAASAIQRLGIFPGFTPSAPRKADIPRSHLSYYARLWEGTSGDRVITAPGSETAKTFAEVAPDWATTQNFTAGNEGPGVQRLLKIRDGYCVRRGSETISDYLARKESCL